MQNYLTQKTINYLEKETQTTVRLDKIYIGFPKSIVLEGLYVEDRQKDTLVDAGYLSVDMNMWALWNSNIEINSLSIERLNSNIYTLAKGQYNFQFIIDAFSGGEREPDTKNKDSKGTKFSIEDISLKDIKFDFDDGVNGMQLALQMGQLELSFDTFSPDEQIYKANYIHLFNTNFDYINSGSDEQSPEDDSEMPPIDIGADELIVDQVKGRYVSQPDKQTILLDIKHAKVTPNQISLPDRQIAIQEVNLQETHFEYLIDASSKTDSTETLAKDDTPTAQKDSPGWKVSIAQLSGKGNSFRYDDNQFPKQDKGIDYNHMYGTNINFSIGDLLFSYPEIEANIHELSLQEQSGFSIQELNAGFEMDSQHMLMQDLVLKTTHTDLQMNGNASFASLETFSDSPGQVNIELQIPLSTVGFRDLLFIQPDLADNPPFKNNQNKSIDIRGQLSGPIANLDIEKVFAEYGMHTKIRASGKVRGLPDFENAYFDIRAPKIISTRDEIRQLFQPEMLPENIRLPERFSANAEFTGTLDDFNSRFQIESNYGGITANGHMKTNRQNKSTFEAELSLENFRLGDLLDDTTLYGTTSLEANIKGQHVNWEEVKAEVNAQIAHITFNQYTYRNIELHSTIDDQLVEVKGNMKDSNLIFTLDGTMNLREEPAIMAGNINIEGADLQALQLTAEDIRTKGNITFDVQGMDPDSLKGHVSISNMLIIKEGKRYYTDSIYVFANTRDTISKYEFHSDFLKGHIEGNVDPVKFAHLFQHHLNHYLSGHHQDSLKAHAYEQQFDFDFEIEESILLTDIFLPGLEELQPASITGKYNSAEHSMHLDGFFPKIIYNGIEIDSFDINLNSTIDAMTFNFNMVSITNPSMEIKNPEFAGKVENSILNASLSIAEDTAYQNLYLGAELTMTDHMYQLEFNEDGVVLDNEQWSVAENHYIRFGDGKFDANNVKISNNNRYIALEKQTDSSVDISFQNFNLQDISQAFKKDQELLTGIMNGNITIQKREAQALYNADVTIDDLKFLTSPIGKLALQAKNSQPNILSVDGTISGDNNDIKLNGTYDLSNEANALDFNIDINRLYMKSIQAFTAGQLNNMEGYMRGDLSVNGSPTDPKVKGNIHFDDTRMRVMRLETTYKIIDQSITFNNDKIRFDNFTILDTLDNKAIFNGTVSVQNLQQPSFQLNAKTENFRLLDKNRKRDDLFYGTLIIDSEINVRGNLARPVISATAKVEEGSDFVLIIPTDDPRLETEGGIDKFVDRDQQLNPLMETDESQDTVRSEIKGLDLRANLSVDRQSEIKIFLDQGGGNYLKVKGEADLVVGINPTGEITLTGRYDIYDGQYQLLFRNVVKRTFDLQEGSSIVWTGNPLKARVNLTATHTKVAEPLGLVQDQLSQDDRAARNRFRQTLPFQIQLRMQDELTSPSIDFDIHLPREQQGAMGGQVQARLSQLNQNESATNKQVFALLVFGRFIPDDPFDVSGGSGAEVAARRGVSRLLNAQLDKFSDKYIDAVDLDMSLESYEDYTTGEAEGRTEVNIGVNKAFFNNRLNVRVGGNVDIEGERRRKQQAGDLIGDISVEYVLTEDGDWKLRAFRKNEYEGIIDGDIIQTGTSIIFSKDYNNIRDLFGKSKEGNNTQ